jgi:hypothetical protein
MQKKRLQQSLFYYLDSLYCLFLEHMEKLPNGALGTSLVPRVGNRFWHSYPYECLYFVCRLKKGLRIYAMYPHTTSLYVATVVDNTTFCRGDDDIIVVEFDEDERGKQA